MRAPGIFSLFAAALGAAACTTYHDGYDGGGREYGRYAYIGDDYDRIGNGCGFFSGSGGDVLDPWLACTREGQDLIRERYDEDRDRSISDATADEANIWFRFHADTDRNMRLTDPEIRAALVNHVRWTRAD